MLKSIILEALADNFKAASQNSDSEKGQNKGHGNNSWSHKESARAHISDAEYELKNGQADVCIIPRTEGNTQANQGDVCIIPRTEGNTQASQ